MKKYLINLSLIIILLLCLCGCSGGKEESGKTELVYGTFYLDESVKEKIREFNETNSEYNLVVKIYEAADMESMQARLHGDIVSGKGPDIIDLYWLDDYEKYAALGVLEDLTPYLEAQGEDFLKQIYEPYLMDGKAYMLIPHFQVGVLFADRRDVGDVEKWKLSTFFNTIETHAGENVFSAGKTADYIEKIVMEESAVYFGGEMSAEKVAENIQNRIQLVLDER